MWDGSFVKDVTESNIWNFTPRCTLSQPCQQVLHMDKGTDVTVRRISKENHNFLRNFPSRVSGPPEVLGQECDCNIMQWFQNLMKIHENPWGSRENPDFDTVGLLLHFLLSSGNFIMA